MNKEETKILERIEKNIKEIKELLKNPKGLLDNEKEPATEKQVYFLKQIGKFAEDISKEEAFKIIKEYKGGKK